MKRIICGIISLLIILSTLASCSFSSTDQPPDESTQNNNNPDTLVSLQSPPVVDSGSSEQQDSERVWLDMLRSQIDPYKDEYLTDFLINEYEGEYLDLMTVDSFASGRFTGTDRWETFVVFSVNTAFHSAGWDRKIAAIYDAETDEIITQKSFGYDKTDLYLLHSYPDPEGDEYIFDRLTNTNILFIGYNVGQGNFFYDIGFYTILDGEWVLIPLPLPFEYHANNDDKAYAYACDTLFYFDVSNDGGLPVYTLTNAFAWRSGMFMEEFHTRSAGNTSNADVNYGSSIRFSEAEIKSAVEAVFAEFLSFSGCDLIKLWYDESRSDSFILNRSWDKENTIILLSDFYVDSTGVFNGFDNDRIYNGWNWILKRENADDMWKVHDWGY